MKKYIVLILTIIVASVFTSCDDYVDIEPKGLVIPKKVEDLQLVMNNGVELPAVGSSQFYMDDNLIIPEQHMQYIRGGLFTAFVPNVYGFKDIFFDEEAIDSDWFTEYEKIGIANYVMQQLPLVSGSAAEKKSVEAQARFQRGFYYWQIVNSYSIHYGAGDPNKAESGIPLVTDFGDVTVDLTRSTIQEVYDFAIEDLKFAEANLPMLPTYIFQGSQWASKGMLARIYLHMADYPKALEYATAALSIKNELNFYPTYVPEFDNTFGDPSRDAGADVEIMVHKTASVPNRFAFVPGQGFSRTQYLYLTDDLEGLYDQVNDTRFTLLTTVDNAAGGKRRFTGWGDIGNSAEAGLTTSEVIMIAAEANARLGNVQAAMDLVNYIRENRIDSTDPTIVNLTAANQQEALQQVLEEKRRDMPFNGVRFFDIKRLNAYDNANIGLSRLDFDQQPVTLPAGDAKWAMPIGVRELIFNPEIGQTPRN